MEAKVALAVVLQRCELRLSLAYVHAPGVVIMVLHPAGRSTAHVPAVLSF